VTEKVVSSPLALRKKEVFILPSPYFRERDEG